MPLTSLASIAVYAVYVADKTSCAQTRLTIRNSVYDTLEYRRSTEPGICLCYHVYDRLRACHSDKGSRSCISDQVNRRNFLRAINASYDSVLVEWNCFQDLPDIRFSCQSTSAWYWIGKVIIFIVSIVDVMIIIVIWGRPFKPSLLSGAALIVVFLSSVSSSEYHVLLFGESFILIIAWIFTLSFLY